MLPSWYMPLTTCTKWKCIKYGTCWRRKIEWKLWYQEPAATWWQQQPTITSPFLSSPNDRKCELNIQAQILAMKTHSLFSVDGKNSELRNPYTHKEATPQQTNDLLTFRSIGEKEFLQRITSFILKQPSTLAPNRKRHLLTFSEGQKKSRKISQLERDRRLIISAMKKKMHFSKRTGRPIDKPGEQLIPLPLQSQIVMETL